MGEFITLTLLIAIALVVGFWFGLEVCASELIQKNMAHYDTKSGELVIAKSCEKPVYAVVK